MLLLLLLLSDKFNIKDGQYLIYMDDTLAFDTRAENFCQQVAKKLHALPGIVLYMDIKQES